MVSTLPEWVPAREAVPSRLLDQVESLPFREFSLHLGCWCRTEFLLVQLSCLFPDWVAALLELAAA